MIIMLASVKTWYFKILHLVSVIYISHLLRKIAAFFLKPSFKSSFSKHGYQKLVYGLYEYIKQDIIIKEKHEIAN